ncbi:MAG: hypothetical protein KF734_07125 [Saprospiraceae bacterium]|nr:hypothetical protein [Saprospiraceae bacterium]
MKGVEKIEHTFHDLTHPKRSYTFWGLLAVLAVAFLLIWAKHGIWLQAPNAYMLCESPDGLKNYMTSAWHVAHDSSYVHYGGMSYPFGEHVLFTDNQPIISAAMQWWSAKVSDISGRTTGIMNVIVAISLLFGAGVLFLLLRKLHLPVWYAGLVSLGMLFLSPQNNRIDGHFALAHTWVLPLLLLLLCRYEERYSRRYQSLQIGFLVWFAAQLHFYYFGISALFLGLYTLVQLCFDPSWRNLRVRLSHLVVMVILPFVLLNIWIRWSDFATDRPSSPYGFTSFIGYWEGVFLPYPEFPFYQWLDKNIVPIRRIDFESRAYIGIAAFAFTLWAVFFRRFRLFEPSWEKAAYHRTHKRYLSGIFITSFVLLIFACGFPFAIEGLEWIADYFGPLRQFRGLGRFNWAFFYVINVVMFYVVWNYSARFKGFFKNEKTAKKAVEADLTEKLPAANKDANETSAESTAPTGQTKADATIPFSRHFRWGIALLPLALLLYEARVFQQIKRIPLNPNYGQRDMAIADCPWLAEVDFSAYQALMPLPYYHVGSENIWLDIDGFHFRRMLTTAFHSGVPDMGVFMSRTSVGRTIKSVQFSLEPLESPQLLDELPDNRPIALMINPTQWEQVQARYPHLLEPAVMVKEYEGMKIMSLIPDSVRVWAKNHSLAVSAEMDNSASHTVGKDWKSDQAQGWFYHQSYDSLSTTTHFFQGKGAYQGNMGDTAWVWNNTMPAGNYHISLWIYVKQDMGMTHEMKIFQHSRADGHEINFRHEGLRFYLKSIVEGWALFDLEFTVHEDNSDVRIFLQKRGVFEPFFLDEVLIRQKDFNLYRREPGWVSKNNYWLKI